MNYALNDLWDYYIYKNIYRLNGLNSYSTNNIDFILILFLSQCFFNVVIYFKNSVIEQNDRKYILYYLKEIVLEINSFSSVYCNLL